MKVEIKLARNASSEAELEWLGRSGVEDARWILAQQFAGHSHEPDDGSTSLGPPARAASARPTVPSPSSRTRHLRQGQLLLENHRPRKQVQHQFPVTRSCN